jgi:thiol-disulfide isomerase/thioredoxin
VQLNSRRFKFLLVSICYVLSLSLGCEKADSDKTPVVSAPPTTTFPMPPVSGKSLGEMGWQLADGQRNTFSQYNGSVLVLDFYATWCMPCRKSIPELINLQDRFRSEGLQIVGLNVGGPNDWPRVPDFVRELNIQYTLGIPDTDLTGFLLSDNQQIPQTFVFDRQGRLTKRLIGFTDSDVQVLRDAVEATVKSK